MAEIQKMTCPECRAEFNYDPESGEVITSLNESVIPHKGEKKMVTIYLKCPNGHVKPYKVEKEY